MTTRGNGAAAGALMVAGAILGAGVALLAAPRSGEDTRRVLALSAKRARRRTKKMADDFTYSVADMVDRAGERAEDILDRGKDLAHGVKREILEALEEGQERLGRQRELLSRILG
jgi:gas vesicle protein